MYTLVVYMKTEFENKISFKKQRNRNTVIANYWKGTHI